MAVSRLAVGALSLLLTVPSSAEEASLPTRTEMKAACAGDVRRLCRGLQPGGGRLVQCLASEAEQVSTACRDVLLRLRAAAGRGAQPPAPPEEAPPS